MKKKLAALMCAAILTLSILPPPSLAAGQQYPVSVEAYTDGDTPCVRKVYQLALSDDPASIPTGDFERDGLLYHFLDMTRKDEVGVDTQPFIKTVTLDSGTGELSEVLKLLDGQMETVTEDGYAGTLFLDHTSVKVEVKGYKTKSRNLSATRSYPNLSDADLSLVPKTVEDKGKTLSLADIQWSNDGEYYTASATYTGTSSSRYATGYAVTATYAGEVSKTNCEVVTYTAIFAGAEPPAPEPSAEQPVDQPDQPAGNGPDRLPMLGCAGSGAVLAWAGMWAAAKRKERRDHA